MHQPFLINDIKQLGEKEKEKGKFSLSFVLFSVVVRYRALSGLAYLEDRFWNP
jgi:hypothetical protein